MKPSVNLFAGVVATDRDGVMRVGGTRVTLDSLVAAFLEGATAEEIQMRYPALRLPDTYAAIAWYLANQQTADRYISEHSRQSALARRQCATRHQSTLRARLVARNAGQRHARAHT